jgi:integrase
MENSQRHKTAVIVGTLTKITNYPKLRIYLNNASPYWQAVYWDRGQTYRRSLKTSHKADAYEQAKKFYEQLIISKYQQSAHLKNHNIFAFNLTPKVKASFTFKFIAQQWISLKEGKWSDAHLIEVDRLVRRNLYPFIANKQISKITKADLLKLLQKIEARGAYTQANRLLNLMRQIWQYAILIDACKNDITIGLSAALHTHAVKHQNAIDIKELPDLMRAISTYDKESDLITRYALQLVALTFVRKNEMVLAKWDEFDLEKAIWKIPAARMKMRVEHTVPLSKQVINILACIKKAYPSNNLVFNKGNPNKTLSENALIHGLYRLGYKHKMSVHGFRAVASTILNEHGFRADVIERQLAHAEGNQVRRAYNRAQYLDERIEMMTWWGDYLEENGLKS